MFIDATYEWSGIKAPAKIPVTAIVAITDEQGKTVIQTSAYRYELSRPFAEVALEIEQKYRDLMRP
ncbi:hypothetical protein FKO01_41280 [Mesorhizobium sp. B2-3-3]|nr:hypothetical protein FKO01_41280 [Mesorhizobium sp. B2-3-3]